MDGRTHRRAVLRTGARIAYAAPIVAASLIVAPRAGIAAPGPDWPSDYDQQLCGCHGPEWRFVDPGGTCEHQDWAFVLLIGGCGSCGRCDPVACPPGAILFPGQTPYCSDPNDPDDTVCPVIYEYGCLSEIVSP